VADDYALYRHYDGNDRLLYIGISGDLATRETSHIARSRWMRLTASSTVEWHETSEAVLKAEREAIEAEHPLFNRQWNDTPEAMERLTAYLTEIGRLDLMSKKPAGQPRPGGGAGLPDTATHIIEGRWEIEIREVPGGIRVQVSDGAMSVTFSVRETVAQDIAEALKWHAVQVLHARFGFPRQVPLPPVYFPERRSDHPLALDLGDKKIRPPQVADTRGGLKHRTPLKKART
jgi:hypothetical protein